MTRSSAQSVQTPAAAPSEGLPPELWFGAPVWARRILDHASLNRQLIEATAKLEAAMPSIHRSNVGGWHSEAGLHRDPDFAAIRRIIERAAVGCANTLGFDFDKADLIFQGMWANRNGPGDFNKAHVHPNAILSGTYYVKVPPASGNIEFYDPVRERTMVGYPVRPGREAARKKIEYTCNDGLLLIFPSWLSHSVQPNRSDEARISIAFNIESVPKRKSRGL
jgi:uncharacterized protein (TIGR02466 family)